MLPHHIVGSVITTRGAEPFALDAASGAVRTGGFESADPQQANMGPMEASAVDKQVRAAVIGVREVRIGAFQCPRCQRWVDVVRDPHAWAGSACSRH